MTESMFVEINHHLSGHWKDELEYPREGLATLKKERKQLGISTGRRSSPSYQEVASPNLYSQIHIEHEPISFINPRTALKVRTKYSLCEKLNHYTFDIDLSISIWTTNLPR